MSDDPIVAYDGIGVWRRSEIDARLAALDQQRAAMRPTKQGLESDWFDWTH